MRVIVSGGGTGGHIYPALAIADKIMEKEPDSKILYIGNDIGMETKLVPDSGYDFVTVPARWLDRHNALGLLKTGAVTMKGKREALHIMKKFKPDVVIGTGGFVCVPVVLAGKSYGADTYIHEQNAFPGMANRFLEKYVKNIFLGFGAASKYFKQPEKHIAVGNPVREIFYDLDKNECRKKLNIPEEDFVVLSFGGSQGSEAINDAIYEVVKRYAGKPGFFNVFGTGSMYYDDIMSNMVNDDIAESGNIRTLAYMKNINEYIAAADVVVSRAGALSVAETCITGTASILIPSPNVTGNHQYYNAKAVADNGGAVLIEEKDMTPDRLIKELSVLKDDPDKLARMEQGARDSSPRDTTDRIYSIIRANLNERKK
ncbi:MAG: undecaprenyldiphospho-muramoylpentapeptide beta-N-acetylglucosaminyltransferase [Eubacteriales bacterium]|nr:undecaprenyldiphospho-muramoylpentapeptide beta-N-acetylglucosaminyltransferase [Eubacteriales bacterium]